MAKNKTLILILSIAVACNVFAMERENKTLSLPEELNFEIFELTIQDLIKDCKSYDDYEQAIKRVNNLRFVSKTVESEIDKALRRIKLRLNNSRFNDLDLDYKFALLFLVGKKANAELINLYVKAELDVNAKDTGDTALIRAAIWGHKEIIQILISKKADVDAISNNGWASLTWAANEGHKEIVQILIDNKADVNAKDNLGNTALMRAAIFGHKEIVDILINNKADINVISNYGYTALKCAADQGYNEIAELIKKAMENVSEKNNK